MFCIVFSGAVPLPNCQGLSTNDDQPEKQLGKKGGMEERMLSGFGP